MSSQRTINEEFRAKEKRMRQDFRGARTILGEEIKSHHARSAQVPQDVPMFGPKAPAVWPTFEAPVQVDWAHVQQLQQQAREQEVRQQAQFVDLQASMAALRVQQGARQQGGEVQFVDLRTASLVEQKDTVMQMRNLLVEAVKGYSILELVSGGRFSAAQVKQAAQDLNHKRVDALAHTLGLLCEEIHNELTSALLADITKKNPELWM